MNKNLFLTWDKILAKKWIVKINKILMVVMIFHMHTLLCILNTLVQNHECKKCFYMDNFDMFLYMNGSAHVVKTWGYKFQIQWIQTKNYNHKRKGEEFYYRHKQSLNKNNTWSHIKYSRITMTLSKLQKPLGHPLNN